MRDDLLEKARGIADRLPLHMNRYNVGRMRAVFAYDLAVAFQEIFLQGVKAGVDQALVMSPEKKRHP